MSSEYKLVTRNSIGRIVRTRSFTKKKYRQYTLILDYFVDYRKVEPLYAEFLLLGGKPTHERASHIWRFDKYDKAMTALTYASLAL